MESPNKRKAFCDNLLFPWLSTRIQITLVSWLPKPELLPCALSVPGLTLCPTAVLWGLKESMITSVGNVRNREAGVGQKSKNMHVCRNRIIVHKTKLLPMPRISRWGQNPKITSRRRLCQTPWLCPSLSALGETVDASRKSRLAGRLWPLVSAVPMEIFFLVPSGV